MAKFLKNITLLLLIFASTAGISQQERGYIRKGNKMFNDSNYVAADSLYLKALQIDSTSIEAKYNLTNSLLKQGNTDEAIKNFNEILEETEDRNILAKAHHNLGNAHVNKQEWQEAVDSYKNALRNDPNDEDARYNYAYAKSKLAKEQDKKNDDKENKDKDQKDKDKKDKGDKNKEDKKKKEGEGGKDKKDENSEKEKKKKEDEQKKKDKENKKKSDKEKGKEDEEKDKKDQKGEKNKPQNDEQKKEKQKKAKAQQIKKKQAEQILRQLDKNEKNIQQQLIRAKMKKQARKKIDKDW